VKTRRTSRSKLFLGLVCTVLALVPPAVAWGASYDYAHGTYGVGGQYPGPGFNSYLYNQVWHATGYYWLVEYRLTNGDKAGQVIDTNNPTKWPNSIGYANPYCVNDTDNSGVTWTCQYGR
jgi:hypothetical protein